MQRVTLALVVAASTAFFASYPSSAWSAVRFFHSPTGNIQCQVSTGATYGTAAFCQTFTPARSVTLHRSGKLKTCRGVKCLGNGPEDATTLKYGKSIAVGPLRCTSLERGMRGVVVRTGRGFELSKHGIRRL
jgi:hypothetical protein